MSVANQTTLLHLQELTRETKLCLANGQLNMDAVGWSRHPVHTCNLSGAWPRKKRWNYWCIADDKFLFSITIASLDYAGTISVYMLDFESKQFEEHSITVPLARGIDLPPRVDGNVEFSNKQISLSITYEPDTIKFALDWHSFKGKALKAALSVQRDKNLESLNVVIPWNLRQFQFTSKQHCMPANGSVSLGDRTWRFTGDTAFACLDYGRGIWPRRIEWNWAAFGTRAEAGVVGFNAGAKWTDNTGSNENGFLVNSKLHKLHEPVEFTYDQRDMMKPWRLQTLFTESVDLIFTPIYERIAKANLWLVQSEIHQMIGNFSGVLRIEDTEIQIDSAVGWAEDHKALW
jgi:hypothetical protein